MSYLLTHECSPFALTERKLTPLDIVTAHSIVPGREGVALLLEEAMRGQGWKGGHMEERRRSLEQREKKKGRRKELREDVGKALDLKPEWWRRDPEFSDSEDSDSEEEDIGEENIYVCNKLFINFSNLPTRRHHVWTILPCLSFHRPPFLKYLIH